MQLTDEQVNTFQALYRARFGKELSKEEALEKSIPLIRLMELIYRPMTLQDQEKVLARQEELNNQ